MKLKVNTRIKVEDLFLLDKRWLAQMLFFVGVLIVYFTSMQTWFLWPISSYMSVIACVFIIPAMLLSKDITRPCFVRKDFVLPVLAYLLLAYYQVVNNSSNFNAYISTLFNALVFFALFRYDSVCLQKVSRMLAKTMAVLLIGSITFFFLYLLGFPLPGSNLEYGDDFYSFTNYYWFLIDDRQLFAFFPRFQAVFPEPAYMGSAAALLLQTQRGNWRKWYCIILLIALLISFSLAGYIYLVAIIFTNLWIRGKRLFLKLILSISFLVAFVVGAFFYNNGDNLVHDLILLRLEVEDGEMAGNNRVSTNFDADYENFWNSSDIFFGREKENEFGDSGYKVFIYTYGLVGLALLVFFYVSAFYKAPNKRAMLSALFLAALVFAADGFILWFCRFIPFYCTAYQVDGKDMEQSNEENEEEVS